MSTTDAQIIILGSGPAGCTAALYAARAGLDCLVLRGGQPGGQLTLTGEVENFPGTGGLVEGIALMERMETQALAAGARFATETVTELTNGEVFEINSDSGKSYSADAVILATGATARWLDVKGELEHRGGGVSACATCDGFFFRGRDVAVVGGGNTAVEEALYLARLARRVTLIHRRDGLRAEKVMQERLLATGNIDVMWNSRVQEVLGDGRIVSGVALVDTVTGVASTLSLDGLFVAIGHSPNTALVKGRVPMDEAGYILAEPDSTRTGIPGLFAAGDVKDSQFRQAITAAGSGCMAALEAERFLMERV